MYSSRRAVRPWTLALLLACTASANDFNLLAVSHGILSELMLELTAPWSTLDFGSELIEGGMALKDNYTAISLDALQPFLFAGIKAAHASVFMHYVGTQTGGGYLGMYNNDTVGFPFYVADRTPSNETCLGLNYTAATADDAYRELARERGVSAGGHCLEGRFLDQTTGEFDGSSTWFKERYDARLRPWFIDAVAAGSRTWSPIYVFAATPHPLGITAARPLYAPFTNDLLGVAALDFLLEDIEIILRDVVGDNSTALAFILDGHSTMLVSASLPGVASGIDSATGEAAQRDALACGVPVIERAAAFTFTSNTVADDDDGVHTFEGEWWVQSSWLKDDYGLLWRVVTMQRIACLAGYANDASSRLGECVACPVGTSGAGGISECEACAAERIAPAAGLSTCVPCPSMSYANDAQSACVLYEHVGSADFNWVIRIVIYGACLRNLICQHSSRSSVMGVRGVS